MPKRVLMNYKLKSLRIFENIKMIQSNNKMVQWLKKVGIVGFLFFLIKGLLWLLIPYLIAKGIL